MPRFVQQGFPAPGDALDQPLSQNVSDQFVVQALQGQLERIHTRANELETARLSLGENVYTPLAIARRRVIDQQLATLRSQESVVQNQLDFMRRPSYQQFAAVEAVRRPDAGQAHQLDPELAAGLTFALVLLVSVPIVLAHARRIWRREGSARLQLADASPPRLERLEQAVEAIALEVDRIGEGQRLVTRLMVERPAADPAMTAEARPGAAKADASHRALGPGPAQGVRLPERQGARLSITPH